MKVDGRALAETIYTDLRERVGELQKKGITPRLAVILVGEDPASSVYIQQKKLRAEQINAIVDILTYPEETTTDTLLTKIRELNNDTTIHGIIVQRPLPKQINQEVLADEISDAKDVDGFKETSPFNVPVVMAVNRLLQEVSNHSTPVILSEVEGSPTTELQEKFITWLRTKKIVLLGKGSTAGKPISDYLTEIGITPHIIDSTTVNPQELTKQADIIICSVGKPGMITPEMIKQGVILIGVGLSKDSEGKLHGDYETDAIQEIASFYTPTPGGVGPLNVAMLMENLITAAEKSTLIP